MKANIYRFIAVGLVIYVKSTSENEAFLCMRKMLLMHNYTNNLIDRVYGESVDADCFFKSHPLAYAKYIQSTDDVVLHLELNSLADFFKDIDD